MLGTLVPLEDGVALFTIPEDRRREESPTLDFRFYTPCTPGDVFRMDGIDFFVCTNTSENWVALYSVVFLRNSINTSYVYPVGRLAFDPVLSPVANVSYKNNPV